MIDGNGASWTQEQNAFMRDLGSRTRPFGTTPATQEDWTRLEKLVDNIWSSRQDFINRFFNSNSDLDSLNAACNYPDSLQAQVYRSLFDRMGIAERVVEVFPKESWKKAPTVYEDEDATNITDFEKAWDSLSTTLQVSNAGKSWHKQEEGAGVWSYLLRADILSGIGVYGIILLGIDDGKLLEQPADGVPADGTPRDITGVGDLQSKDIYGGALPPALSAPLSSTMGTDAQYFGVQFSTMQPPGTAEGKNRRLLFLRCFDESLVQVVQYEASLYSPRFGMPVMYRVTLNDPRTPHTGVGLPLATIRVHWSRIVHLADNLYSSEIFGKPRMRPVLNNILDLRKLYGGSAEMYWRGAFPGLSIESHPQLGGDVDVNWDQVRQMMGDYAAGLQRWLGFTGFTAKSLAPQVVDPSPQIDKQIEAICIELGCPVRVFKGSERGELASSQDDEAWNERMAHRQQFYLTPKVIVPFIDRLILLGILPEPEQYNVLWPDPEAIGDKDRAAIGFQKTQSLSAYVAGNCESVLPIERFYTEVWGLEEEKAKEIVDEARDKMDAEEDDHLSIPEPKPGAAPKPGQDYVEPPEPPPAPPGAFPGSGGPSIPGKGASGSLGKAGSAGGPAKGAGSSKVGAEQKPGASNKPAFGK